MEIFLDSNIFYSDPFMSSLYNKLLLELSEADGVNLYVSDVVLKESINNFEKKIKEHLEKINKEKEKMERLVNNEIEISVDVKHDSTYYVNALKSFYDDLIEKGVIQIVGYDNDILPELVERSIKRIKPFSDNKMEFRDAIIWLSYVAFAEENGFEKCHFITRNKNDFANKDGVLHEDLRNDSESFILYNSARELIEQNNEEINTIKRSVELEKWVEEENLINRSDEICRIIETQAFDKVHNECINFIEKQDAEFVMNMDFYDYAYLNAFGLAIHDVESMNVEVVYGKVIITGKLHAEVHVEVYEYNIMYEPGDEQYFYRGSDSVDLIVEFSLTLSEEYKIKDFEVGDIDFCKNRKKIGHR
jgi:predicted nucleic acid-binding protein